MIDNMKSYEINDEKSLKQLIPQWERLYDNCLVASPFQSPYWLYCWWQYFGCDRMRVLSLWDNDKLVGIAPFFIYKKEKRSILCLMGTGISDYLDVLIDPQYSVKGIEHVWKYVADIQKEWDECDFQELKQESILLKSRMPENLSGKIFIQSTCPYLVLPDSMDKLFKIMSKKFRNNIRRCNRKIELNENVNISTDSGKDIIKNLDELVWLHRARWESRMLPGVMKEETLLRFYRKVSSELKNRKMVDVYIMRIGQNAVAAYYIFTKNDTAYAYLGGFDPTMEKYSPGTVMLYHVIDDAVKKRLKYFDFLRGNESYKYKWKPYNKYNCQIRVFKK